jgi:hypothetical protein
MHVSQHYSRIDHISHATLIKVNLEQYKKSAAICSEIRIREFSRRVLFSFCCCHLVPNLVEISQVLGDK